MTDTANSECRNRGADIPEGSSDALYPVCRMRFVLLVHPKPFDGPGLMKENCREVPQTLSELALRDTA
jgi:hypothetical protein